MRAQNSCIAKACALKKPGFDLRRPLALKRNQKIPIFDHRHTGGGAATPWPRPQHFDRPQFSGEDLFGAQIGPNF